MKCRWRLGLLWALILGSLASPAYHLWVMITSNFILTDKEWLGAVLGILAGLGTATVFAIVLRKAAKTDTI